jgi:hypothetical protein
MGEGLEPLQATDGPSGLATRRSFLRGSGAVAAAGVTTLATGGLLSGVADGATHTTTQTASTSTADRRHAVLPLQQTAQNAVIFGAPAVLESRYFKLSEQAGITLNRFSVNLTLSTPDTHVAGPNDDTLYGLTWLDLTEGPQVIEVPATHGRYYSIQLIDMWSNSFAYIGLRATGDRAGAFAITPPGWSGKLPAGVKQIKATTKRLLALVRTFVKDPKDLPAAQKIHTSYTTGPLSSYPRGRIKSRIVPDAAALNVFAPIDLTGSDASLYKEINSLINEYPPLPADAKHAKTLRSVGVDVKHYAQPSSTLTAVLQAAIKPAIGQILADLPTLQTQVDGWSVNLHVAKVTHDPLRRAALTIYGPGTHVAMEALYFGVGQLDGLPLTGAHDYTLTFPKGQLPPVGAFWSLILYDATTFWLVANPINRYEVASHTDGLIYGADGALTIAVQPTQPSSPAVNWLPAPAGAFRLILRTYIPKPAILDGAWTPPPLTQTA